MALNTLKSDDDNNNNYNNNNNNNNNNNKLTIMICLQRVHFLIMNLKKRLIKL